ncbi:MAG: hypothetical protein P4L53_08885 [Candidatus Obscuribacterales bacterium]|nr:hypothetical protein [Candidatus Obscuribacterales bacterium]
MVIGNEFPPEKNSGDKTTSDNQKEATAAQERWHEELAVLNKTPAAKDRAVELAANDVTIGPNGMPLTDDPISNMVGNRVAGHMHDYSKDTFKAGIPGADPATGRRATANSADMEAGLFGPKSPQNTAQYDGIMQDFHTVDSNFKKELADHGISGPQAEQMRQFLFFSTNQNQRNQLLKIYNLSEPAGFDSFEKKYGNKASLALHWAMEQN